MVVTGQGCLPEPGCGWAVAWGGRGPQGQADAGHAVHEHSGRAEPGMSIRLTAVLLVIAGVDLGSGAEMEPFHPAPDFQ